MHVPQWCPASAIKDDFTSYVCEHKWQVEADPALGGRLRIAPEDARQARAGVLPRDIGALDTISRNSGSSSAISAHATWSKGSARAFSNHTQKCMWGSSRHTGPTPSSTHDFFRRSRNMLSKGTPLSALVLQRTRPRHRRLWLTGAPMPGLWGCQAYPLERQQAHDEAPPRTGGGCPQVMMHVPWAPTSPPLSSALSLCLDGGDVFF